MAHEQAVPEQQSEKKQGDELEHVLNAGTKESSGPSGESAKPTPQQQPLK